MGISGTNNKEIESVYMNIFTNHDPLGKIDCMSRSNCLNPIPSHMMVLNIYCDSLTE